MAKNIYKSDSDTINVTLGANTVSGAPVVSGGLLTVLKYDGLTGEEVPAFKRGQARLTKLAGGGTAWTIGTPIHWDTANARCTKTPSATTVYAGLAAEPAADAATTGIVDLNVKGPMPLWAAAGGASVSAAELETIKAQAQLYGYMKTA